MASFGWDTAPDAIRQQVKRFVRDVRAILGEHLVGIYLHGSLAMGCFNPEFSDVDLLVVLKRPMLPETKRLLAGLLLTLSEDPRPLEVSFLLQEELRHWCHPLPYDFHYSESWRERYEANLTRLEWEYWGNTEHTDPDLAAHITILQERGIVLYGPCVRETFPLIPPGDYAAAILYDYAAALEGLTQAPVYGVLNMLRVYWYLLEGAISSKAEAGQWGVETLQDPEVRSVVAQALGQYLGAEATPFDPEALERFARVVDEGVRLFLPESTEVAAPAADGLIDCTRCHTVMRFAGVKHFHEGESMAPRGGFWELFAGRETLHMYFCPICGKVEFYLRPVPGQE